MKKKSSIIRAVDEFYLSDKSNINFWLSRAERYSPERVVATCLRAGTDEQTATQISRQVDHFADSRIKMSEVRPLIFALLQRKDPEAAKKFRAGETYIQTSAETFERFDRSKIAKSLIKETGLDKEIADQIAFEVEKFIKTANLGNVSSSLVREIANVKLLEHGLEGARKLYTRIGMPVFDITQTIFEYDRENANLLFSPETVHKKFADNINRQYTLTTLLPPKLADAHIDGKIHIGDLDYFPTRPFCQDWDLRYFLRYGLKVDGSGRHTSVAGPAKHAEVAILHAAKVLCSAQTNWNGGQGFDNFNIWLAPFFRGLDEKRARQLVQMFLYEMNMVYVARGSQPVFSSISLEPSVPKFISNLPAVLPGGKVSEGSTYADFVDDAQSIFRLFMEEYLKGDAVGKQFDFPKPEIKIRKEFLNDPECSELYLLAARLSAKFGSSYYLNLAAPYMPEMCCSQCCRYFMAADKQDVEDLNNGTLNVGALQVVTVNLPRIALESKDNDSTFFEILEERMELAKQVLLIKRDVMKKIFRQGLLPFADQPKNPHDPNSPPFWEIDRQSLNIGFVGLNEALKIHTGYELHENESSWEFGLKVIKRMVEIKNKLAGETGLKWGIVQTPAESLAHRLAKIDLNKFNGRAYVQGDKSTGSVYYTNSSHVNVGANIPLSERIKIEVPFHALTGGGAILHVFLGETYPDQDVLDKFNRTLATKTLASYWAITKDLMHCLNCKTTVGGRYTKCPNCNSDKIEIFSRVTGYYGRVSNWNEGKQQEWRERHQYSHL